MLVDKISNMTVYVHMEDKPVNGSDGRYMSNPTSSDTLVMYRKWLEGFILLFYTIVFLFGLSSNSVLTYLILTRKFMNKYVFTASISVAHIIVCVVVIPIVIVHCVTSDVKLERPCHVMMCISVGVTSYSMLATAVRRYLALSDRFRHTNFTYKGKFINLAGIWLVSLALAVPLIYSSEPSMYNILPSTYFQVMRGDSQSTNNEHTQHTPTIGPYRMLVSNADSTMVVNTPRASDKHGNHGDTNTVKNQSKIDGDLDIVSAGETSEGSVSDFWIYSVIMLCVQVIVPCVTSLILQVVSYRAILSRPNQSHWLKEINITRQHIFMIILFAVCYVALMSLNLLDVLRHFTVSPFLIRCLQPLAVSLVMYFPVIYYFQNAYIKREFLQWLSQVTGWSRRVNT